MHKAQLVEKIASQTDSSKEEAGRYIDAILSAIEQELKSGGEVNIQGFGKFNVQQRNAREGVNPQTGEKMQIAASRVPKFTAGNALKKAL